MGETGSPKTNVNVEEKLREFIEKEVNTLRPPSKIPSIYRVPKDLREGRAKFFDPIAFPIGPLHYNSKSPAQVLKKWCLKSFIARMYDVDKALFAMSSLENEFRDCYEDLDPSMEGHELVKIMLLDGCFIMELLRGFQNYDFFNTTPLLLHQDLLKIENQLPFFVLQILAGLAPTNKGDSYLELVDSSLKLFDIPKPKNFKLGTGGDRPRHLLELIMNAFFHNNIDPSFAHNQYYSYVFARDGVESLIRDTESASQLAYYGVEFRPVKLGQLSFRFGDGIVYIPPLVIEDSTPAVLWNFLIFEKLSCRSRHLASYVVLMDTFIHGERDVDVLLRQKILVRKSNISGVVSLFNDMSANVSLTSSDFYFAPLLRSLETYCRTPYIQWRAAIVRSMYDGTWDAYRTLNNFLLLFLTVKQTFFSVLAYKPK